MNIASRVCFSMFFFIIALGTAQCQQWFPFAIEDSLAPSAGIVTSLYADDTVLYVGGSFLSAGGDTVRSIARWNTLAWESVGNGIYDGGVECIEKYNNKIYAGGWFTQQAHPYAEKIDCWNGYFWEGVPNSYGEISSPVFALTVYDNMLIIGGNFNSIGPFPFNFSKIAAYDGSDYVCLGNLGQQVHALTTYNGELIAGGYFPTVKKYDGNSWQDISGNFNYYIQDFDVDTFNNFLYAAGGFTVADDAILTDNVAMWDGFNWNRVGHGANYTSSVRAVKIYHGEIYAGLVWDTLGGDYTGYLARWNGHNWRPAGDTVRWTVWDLAVFKDTLYVGGKDYEFPTSKKGFMGKWYMPPDTLCKYLQPRVFSLDDTYDLNLDSVSVQFYNNNAYADSWDWDFGDGGIDNIKDPLHVYTDTGSYSVSVTVTHQGCVKTAYKTISVHDVSGVDNYSKEDLGFKLYPNPTTGNVTVEVTIPQNKEGELRSYSMYGSLLGTYPVQVGFNKVLIPASRWSPGTALVVLMIDGRQVVVEKVVKN